ncbi:hypothetical protein NPIL_310311 [Nephila pilipes]|uniref:Uncharacterized protein n=1 Tax=Nephila pilipes TaxID=299642 RepID=A0A8X6P4B4_NEPPI|nr:hypothetical protein NPIL_310311 [Nephila pilipes]
MEEFFFNTGYHTLPGLKCAMEETKQDSDDDSAITFFLTVPKRRIPFSSKNRRHRSSFKDIIETERKWKYRKKTFKFQ